MFLDARRRFATLIFCAILAMGAGNALAQTTDSYYAPPSDGFGPSGQFAEEDVAFPSDSLPAEPAAFSEMAESGEAAPACSCGETDKGSCGNCPPAKKKPTGKAAVAGSHKGLFYNNDFGYVLDPNNCDCWLGDAFKRRSPNCFITYDIGGQYRMRHHSERNIRGLGLTGRDDDFLLHRVRMFANVEVGNNLRFFAEYLDAVSNYENFNPRPIEENRSDFLNLFVDAVLLDTGDGKLTGRVGRQELFYGNQRAVSPLDWANTRRTFDGGKFMWQSADWDVDAFWTRPLRTNFNQFDSPIQDEQFYGIYSTFKGCQDTTVELYWLAFDDDATGFRADSLGGRYLKTYQDWMAEIWGNYQFGSNADDSDHNAGAWTVGLGRKLDHSWKPELWLYYDWASGDDAQGAGNGYHHFFPLAHKYLGFMDLFGRRNIESPNVLLTMQPTEKVKVLLWYYYLYLQNRNDTPYSVVMTPFFPGVRPGSAELGHEIDLTIAYNMGPRTNLLFGYSHFFSGDYYDTPGLPHSGDADFFYTQFHVNF